MNIKFGLAASAAVACVVITGCKAPKAQSQGRPVRPAQRVVVEQPAPAPKPIQTVTPAPAPKPVQTVTPAPAPAPEPIRCKCAPGTVHTAPCACGAFDCKCKVKPAEPEYTLYRVKGGDMLSSICATYGLKQSKVLELNPGLEANKLYVGKKIKLPGKIDLKDSDVKSLEKTALKKSAKAQPAKAYAKVVSYKGATKEYVVASGDSLGKIAYSNGITIKCLKEMNGLKKNSIRVGQKLKVPAEKPVATVKAEPKKESVKPVAGNPEPAKQTNPAPATDAPAAPVTEETTTAPSVAPATTETAPVEPAVTTEPVVESVPAEPAPAASSLTHTVKAGEDTVSIAIMYGVSPSAVMDLNNLKNTDELTPGQVLKLPSNAKAQ